MLTFMSCRGPPCRHAWQSASSIFRTACTQIPGNSTHNLPYRYPPLPSSLASSSRFPSPSSVVFTAFGCIGSSGACLVNPHANTHHHRQPQKADHGAVRPFTANPELHNEHLRKNPKTFREIQRKQNPSFIQADEFAHSPESAADRTKLRGFGLRISGSDLVEKSCRSNSKIFFLYFSTRTLLS